MFDHNVEELHPDFYSHLIEWELKTDIGTGDITSECVVSEDVKGRAVLIAKENGIICGLPVLMDVFRTVYPEMQFQPEKQDGDWVEDRNRILSISGPLRAILTAERTALNFFQRCSGIATKTHSLVQSLMHSKIQLLDTRKTLPGYRMLDKYSVRKGGGENHRIGLFDVAMIKDNHIQAAGSITKAVELVRRRNTQIPIEVEVTNEEQVHESLPLDIQILMLDNMKKEQILTCLSLINHRFKVEISGNITSENMTSYSDLPIDYISMGALTHSVKAFDCSLLIE